MKSKKALIVIIVAFVLLIGGASVLYSQLGDKVDTNQLATQPTADPTTPTSDGEEEHPKSKAPDFVVYDAAGKEVRLSDYVGNPVVLNFWASWCGPCQGEMPEFNEKYLELGDKIQFIMLNLSGSDYPQDARDLISQAGYQFPVFWDRAEEGGYRYRVSAIPMTVFIGADGQIVEQYVGMMDKETLEHYISLIYTEAP